MNKRLTYTAAAILALLAITAAICRLFLSGGTGKEPGSENDNVPILSAEVVERISSGEEVFLTYWHDGKFQRFSELAIPRFDHTRPAVVLVHGLFQSSDNDWLADMATRIKDAEPATEILAVDWSKLSLKGKKMSWESVVGDTISIYSNNGDVSEGDGAGNDSASKWWERLKNIPGKKTSKDMLEIVAVVKSIPPVAEKAAEYLFGESGLALQPSATHVIGFSHGAHVSGLIGKKTDGGLRRLTLLDPSTRIVHFESSNIFGVGWDSQSARFTDMYQTSLWAGAGKAYGHKTFKVVEEGKEKAWLPPSPLEDIRRHNFAPKWFISTVGSEHRDYGYSMTIPDEAEFQNGTWTETIVVKLPEEPNETE